MAKVGCRRRESCRTCDLSICCRWSFWHPLLVCYTFFMKERGPLRLNQSPPGTLSVISWWPLVFSPSSQSSPKKQQPQSPLPTLLILSNKFLYSVNLYNIFGVFIYPFPPFIYKISLEDRSHPGFWHLVKWTSSLITVISSNVCLVQFNISLRAP